MTVAVTITESQSSPSDQRSAGGLSFIELLRKTAEKPCTNYNTPILIGYHKTEPKIIYSRASCDTWSCPSCGARKALQWTARVINGINTIGGDWYFGTITAHGNAKSTVSSLANIRRGWRKLYDRIRYHYGSMTYVKVFEMHKDSRLHMHWIMNIPITTRWLKDHSAKVGMGHQADSKPIDNAGIVGGYVAKYLGKQLQLGDAWVKNMQRISVSKDFPKLPEMPGSSDWGWAIHFDPVTAKHQINYLWRTDHEIIDLRQSPDTARNELQSIIGSTSARYE